MLFPDLFPLLMKFWVVTTDSFLRIWGGCEVVFSPITAEKSLVNKDLFHIFISWSVFIISWGQQTEQVDHITHLKSFPYFKLLYLIYPHTPYEIGTVIKYDYATFS